jgi:hypothetical protein
MGKLIFGFHARTVSAPRWSVGLAPEQETAMAQELYGEANQTPSVVEVSPSLFAMSVPRRSGPPMVHQYPNDPAGHNELSNLIRGEVVLAVVLGHKVEFEHSSVVDLTGDGVMVTNRTVHNK